MTERFLISGRHQALCAVDATRRVLEGGHRVETVAALLEKIIDEVADTMDRVADKIGAEIDGIEERILPARSSRRCGAPSAGRGGPRCGCTASWQACARCFTGSNRRTPTISVRRLRLQAGKLAQRLDGLDHAIVELRERSRLLEEELHFKIEEQSNHHLQTLSIVTALLMPPTLVTGIFGMNTKDLPFTDVETGIPVGRAADGLSSLARLFHHEAAWASSDSSVGREAGPPRMSSLRRLVVLRRRILRAPRRPPARSLAPRTKAPPNGWLRNGSTNGMTGLPTKGLNFGATYIGDNIGNVSGGTSRGFIHLGRFDFSVDADLEKLVGWTGGRFYANTFEIYGRGLSRNYIHNLATISESEALPDARLYNAYFEQSFYNKALNIRIGQQAADVEFFDSETDDLFINGTFGWPAIKATNLPAGGPAPPIACPGFASRLRYRTSSPPLARCSTAMQRDLETATRSFATITVWRFASTIRRGSSGRSASTTISTLVAARSPVTSPGRLVSLRPIRRSALHRAGSVDRRP